MILEKQTEANIEKVGDSQESIGMSLDMESAQVLMQMLSKNLYSDAIGSTIRECASNALDSHRRAGVTDPIIVSFQVVNGNHEFSVEDFGIGLDADDVKNIISKYGKSTKRNSTTELGMMGLGFKAPLAYSSSFYFICRKDGMERKYMMYEGEDTNTIDILYETPTTERNGVKVIVPVKHSDRWEFDSKIKEQLAYFENVYFDVPGMDNQFVIHRSEHFQWSELCSDGKMHICLDDVYYPIDFQKIGYTRDIYFPVGLRFGLSDGIFPTPNRESIRYTKEAKAIILEKIGNVADYYIERFNEQMKETEDLKSVIDWFNYSARNINIDGRKIDISPIINFSNIQMKQPNLKGLNHLTTKFLHDKSSMFMLEYENNYSIDNGKMRKTERAWTKGVDWRTAFDERVVTYIYSEKVGGNVRDYLKQLHPKQAVRLIRKKYHIPLRKGTSQETYYEMLHLRNHPKSEWRAIIKEWQYVVSLITSKFNNLDELEIPKAWLDAKKKTHIKVLSNGAVVPRKVKLEGDIIGKEASPLERYVDGQSCKFVPTTYRLEKLHQHKKLYVYGKDKDRKQMDMMFKAFKPVVTFVMFSEREFNAMQKINIHNWITMEEFMKGDNKPFRRIATAYILESLSDKFSSAFSRHGNLLATVSVDLYIKMMLLNDYEKKNLHYSDDKVKAAIVEVAEANNLFDGEIYPIYKEVKKVLEELPFIETICSAGNDRHRDIDSRWVLVMRDLFRFHKRRMGWKNYNITLNEDVVESITEEIINEA
jgi:hypothetical protein